MVNKVCNSGKRLVAFLWHTSHCRQNLSYSYEAGSVDNAITSEWRPIFEDVYLVGMAGSIVITGILGLPPRMWKHYPTRQSHSKDSQALSILSSAVPKAEPSSQKGWGEKKGGRGAPTTQSHLASKKQMERSRMRNALIMLFSGRQPSKWESWGQGSRQSYLLDCTNLEWSYHLAQLGEGRGKPSLRPNMTESLPDFSTFLRIHVSSIAICPFAKDFIFKKLLPILLGSWFTKFTSSMVEVSLSQNI